jgi:hypothetical protein
MRWLPAGICLLLAGVCLAADTPVAAPSLCSNSRGAPACHGPLKDLKAARQAFARGLKLEKSQNDNLQNLDQAFYEFEEAARLVPQNVDYLTAREFTRQQLAGLHLERGNSDLLAGRQVEALAEFRTALTLDPKNEFAQQRISDALGPAPVHAAAPPQVVASANALTAKPLDGPHDIHYRGDSRGLVTAVASQPPCRLPPPQPRLSAWPSKIPFFSPAPTPRTTTASTTAWACAPSTSLPAIPRS